MIRKIIIPKYFDVELEEIAKKKKVINCNGILICEPEFESEDAANYFVRAHYLTGAEHHLTPMREKEIIFDLFFKNNPQYKPVLWHKHPRATYSFGTDDLNYYSLKLKKDPEFIAFIAYPRGRRIYSSALTTLSNDSEVYYEAGGIPEDFTEKQKEIERLVLDCSNELGMPTFPMLRVRK